MFTHDTEEALEGAAALVNTMPGSVPGDSSPDTLTTLEHLDDLFAAQPWTGRFDHDAPRARGGRGPCGPGCAGSGSSTRRGVVELVNTLLAESRAVPQLVDHDGVGWHIHATPADAPLAQRMAVEAAFAAIDVVRADELRRLRVCEARRLRRRRHRPLAQPVPALLRRRLRRPSPHRGLPRPQAPGRRNSDVTRTKTACATTSDRAADLCRDRQCS